MRLCQVCVPGRINTSWCISLQLDKLVYVQTLHLINSVGIKGYHASDVIEKKVLVWIRISELIALYLQMKTLLTTRCAPKACVLPSCIGQWFVICHMEWVNCLLSHGVGRWHLLQDMADGLSFPTCRWVNIYHLTWADVLVVFVNPVKKAQRARLNVSINMSRVPYNRNLDENIINLWALKLATSYPSWK